MVWLVADGLVGELCVDVVPLVELPPPAGALPVEVEAVDCGCVLLDVVGLLLVVVDPPAVEPVELVVPPPDEDGELGLVLAPVEVDELLPPLLAPVDGLEAVLLPALDVVALVLPLGEDGAVFCVVGAGAVSAESATMLRIGFSVRVAAARIATAERSRRRDRADLHTVSRIEARGLI